MGKGVLKIRSKFTGEHTCQNAISIKLLCNFIEIALRHLSSLNLQHIFRTPFSKNTSGGCFRILELHVVNLIAIFSHWTVHADLILYYFLDQIRMTCFAGLSHFFAYTKIICQDPSRTSDCETQIAAKKNCNLRMILPLIKIVSNIDYLICW